jgi:hypothetical protein
MKIKVVVVTLAAFLLVAGAAQAFRYTLPFYKAQNDAKAYTKRLCAEERECEYWAVKCERLTAQRINCQEALWFPGIEAGESLRCDQVAKYGIGPGGYITRNFTKPHCHYVYE